MSLKSSCSTLTEVPGVPIAVGHLQELALRMKDEEFGFGEPDVNNIDQIIESIQELHTEVSKLHEKLETETIKASVLRHKLLFFPTEIKNEMQDAIKSARQSNADELNRLQQQLDKMNENIEVLTNKHKTLELENAVLHPERDGIRSEHEEIIAQLNQRMAEKASKQITLNETRDKLRETNQKIVDLEEGILQLKEDLIQERAEARMEKKKLKKAVYDTTVKTKEQKEANIIKKKELDDLHEKVMDSEGKLDNVRKSIRRYETSKSRLEGQDRALTAQLNRENKRNAEMTDKGVDLRKKIEEQEAAWNKKKNELTQCLEELEKNTNQETEKNDILEVTKLDIEAELRDKREIQKEDEAKVKEHNEILQAAKMDLANKAEDVARLQTENIEMEQRILELSESHDIMISILAQIDSDGPIDAKTINSDSECAIIATLQKQIDEAREQLGKERKERIELQERRDSVQKDIDDYKVETNRFLNEQNRRINEGKRQHDELTREGNALQKSLREGEDNIHKLKEEKDNAQKTYNSKKENLEGTIKTLQDEIVTMGETIERKKTIITERMPSFEALEADYENKTLEYDKVKKDVVTLKNKRMGLEDSVKRAKRDIEKMDKPHTQLKDELQKKRVEAMDQLKSQAEQTKNTEQDIYRVGCKLKTALEENDRFQKAVFDLENEIISLKKQIEENEGVTNNLESNLHGLKVALNQEWDKDNDVEKHFASRDQGLVDELGDLLSKATKRENVITDITGKLESELVVLSDFLDNVAKRRPKVKNTSKSPRAQATPKPPVREKTKKPAHKNAIESVADANFFSSPSRMVTPQPPKTPKSSSGRNKTPVTFSLPDKSDTVRSLSPGSEDLLVLSRK